MSGIRAPPARRRKDSEPLRLSPRLRLLKGWAMDRRTWYSPEVCGCATVACSWFRFSCGKPRKWCARRTSRICDLYHAGCLNQMSEASSVSNREEPVGSFRINGLPGRRVSRRYTDFPVEWCMLRVPDTRYVFIFRLRSVRQFVVALAGCEVRLRLCLVSHCPGDDERGLRGGVPQRGIVEMGVNGGGAAPAVSEQSSDGGKTDAVDDALRSPRVPAVVDAKSG